MYKLKLQLWKIRGWLLIHWQKIAYAWVLFWWMKVLVPLHMKMAMWVAKNYPAIMQQSNEVNYPSEDRYSGNRRTER